MQNKLPNPDFTSRDAAQEVLTERLQEIAGNFPETETDANALIKRLNDPLLREEAFAPAMVFVTKSR